MTVTALIFEKVTLAGHLFLVTNSSTKHHDCLTDDLVVGTRSQTEGTTNMVSTLDIHLYFAIVTLKSKVVVQKTLEVLLKIKINPLNPELNPICYLLALLAHHFLHVSRIRLKSLTFRRLMSYMYMTLVT